MPECHLSAVPSMRGHPTGRMIDAASMPALGPDVRHVARAPNVRVPESRRKVPGRPRAEHGCCLPRIRILMAKQFVEAAAAPRNHRKLEASVETLLRLPVRIQPGTGQEQR